jgi:hypothetical protein
MRELGEARQQRVAVEQARQRIDHRLAAVVELGRLQRPDDRDDADEQRERRDEQRRVVDRPARMAAERRREDDRDGQADTGDHDLWAKSRRDHRRWQDHPRQRDAAWAAAEHDACADQQHREDDRVRADPLGMLARADPPLDVGEVEHGEHEQQQRPPADPRSRAQQREPDRARADRPDRAHAVARVEHAPAIELGRAEPGPPFHVVRFGCWRRLL